MSHSQSSSRVSTSTATVNRDERNAIGGSGEIYQIKDNHGPVNTAKGSITTLSNVRGNTTITSSDPDVLKSALQTVKDLAGGFADAVKDITSGSNELASQVVDSQGDFVEKASGNKTLIYIVGGLGLVALFVWSQKKGLI